ncbi:MAG: helix-turn-helix domain-containing protein [Bacteroidetes bacterium]|nr:helix-turn-helix domain-containing protein [Bacteroidota bacterium]
MKTVKSFIERGSDGKFSVYVDLNDNTLNYGITGTGDTVKEAKDDFISAYKAMKALYAKKRIEFTEATFEYNYDTRSFLNYYTAYFSLAGLSRLTGINQGQLSHYVNGVRNPSKHTIQKIDTAIQAFTRNLSRVHIN